MGLVCAIMAEKDVLRTSWEDLSGVVDVLNGVIESPKR